MMRAVSVLVMMVTSYTVVPTARYRKEPAARLAALNRPPDDASKNVRKEGGLARRSAPRSNPPLRPSLKDASARTLPPPPPSPVGGASPRADAGVPGSAAPPPPGRTSRRPDTFSDASARTDRPPDGAVGVGAPAAPPLPPAAGEAADAAAAPAPRGGAAARGPSVGRVRRSCTTMCEMADVGLGINLGRPASASVTTLSPMRMVGTKGRPSGPGGAAAAGSVMPTLAAGRLSLSLSFPSPPSPPRLRNVTTAAVGGGGFAMAPTRQGPGRTW